MAELSLFPDLIEEPRALSLWHHGIWRCRLPVSRRLRHRLCLRALAIVEVEVDDALERLRYERRADSAKAGYRDGHDRPRSIASNRGPIGGCLDAVAPIVIITRRRFLFSKRG